MRDNMTEIERADSNIPGLQPVQLGVTDHGGEVSSKQHFSRGLLVFYVVTVLIISGNFYAESMRKPDELPQRFKVTMIEKMSLAVLQTVSGGKFIMSFTVFI